MLCMGSVRNLIIETVKSGKVQFDVAGFLESVVLADMNVTGRKGVVHSNKNHSAVESDGFILSLICKNFISYRVQVEPCYFQCFSEEFPSHPCFLEGVV